MVLKRRYPLEVRANEAHSSGPWLRAEKFSFIYQTMSREIVG